MKTYELTERRRKAHHAALETLAREVGCETDGLTLWRKLGALEKRLYRVCLDYTNGENGVGTPKWEFEKEQARLDLARVFGGRVPAGVFINGDPRGHMLKLDNEARAIPDGMATDWGSNGILAIEINPED